MKKMVRILVIFLGGTGIGLSLTGFPVYSWLAWVSLVPLFLHTRRPSILAPNPSVRTTFGLGALTGTGMSLVVWIWLPGTIATMSPGQLWLGTAFLGLLILFWAVCFGLFALAHAGIGHWISTHVKSSVSGYLLPWVTASLWVLFEFAFTIPIAASGFTFLPNLGYSQWNSTNLIQVASLTGVFGISFVIVLLNATVAEMLSARRWRVLLPAVGVLAFVWISGWLRIQAADHTPRNPGPAIRVAILQGDIPPFPKFKPADADLLANRYLALARGAATNKPDLVIWTETAIPWALEKRDDLVETALRITQPSQACHLVGTIYRSPDGPTNTFHNTAFLVMPDGRIVAQYHKIRLIPLAEAPVTVPGISRPVCTLSGPNGERMTPGSRLSALQSPFGRIGVMICNENFYSDMTRALVRRGAEILVTIGNDGWCWGTIAHRQHLGASVFRAVEAGRDLVVANNSGISGILDAFGRLRGQTKIHQVTCFTGSVQGRNRVTFYSRHGDLLVALCLGLLLALPLLARIPGLRA